LPQSAELEAQSARGSPFRPKAIRLCAAGLLAILTDLAFLSLLPARWYVNESTDYYHFYEPVARNVISANGLVSADGTPALEYPPGFPLILAAAFETADLLGISESLTLRMEILLSRALTAILIYLIAARIYESRTAVVALLLWATYPLELWLTKQPDSGQVFTVLFLLSIYIFLVTVQNPRRINAGYFVIGILAGLGSLIRPIGLGIGLVFILAACLLPPKGRLPRKPVAVMLLVFGNLLAIAPWEVWAWRVSGRWIPLSTNGPASMFDGLTFSALRQPLDLPLPAAVENVIQEYVTNVGEMHTTGRLVQFTAAEIMHHPVAMAELFAIKASRSWYATDSRRLEKESAAVQLLYLVPGVWALIVAGRRKPPQSTFALLVILFTGYFWVMSILTLSIVRYMLPAMALAVTIIAAGPWVKFFDKQQSYSSVHSSTPPVGTI